MSNNSKAENTAANQHFITAEEEQSLLAIKPSVGEPKKTEAVDSVTFFLIVAAFVLVAVAGVLAYWFWQTQQLTDDKDET